LGDLFFLIWFHAPPMVDTNRLIRCLTEYIEKGRHVTWVPNEEPIWIKHWWMLHSLLLHFKFRNPCYMPYVDHCFYLRNKYRLPYILTFHISHIWLNMIHCLFFYRQELWPLDGATAVQVIYVHNLINWRLFFCVFICLFVCLLVCLSFLNCCLARIW
jgi:hypothetical protein